MFASLICADQIYSLMENFDFPPLPQFLQQSFSGSCLKHQEMQLSKLLSLKSYMSSFLERNPSEQFVVQD